jgi:hypothetical protein
MPQQTSWLIPTCIQIAIVSHAQMPSYKACALMHHDYHLGGLLRALRGVQHFIFCLDHN